MKTRISLTRRAIFGGALTLLLAASPIVAGGVPLARENRLSPLALGYLERGRLMLRDGNYAGVADQLKHLDTQGAQLTEREREDCTYLLAMALYERDDAGCIDLLRDFIESYPASPLALTARLAAADYFFFAGKFGNALSAYSDIDFSRIPPADRPTYDYRKALSMTKTGEYTQARSIFSSLRDEKGFEIPSLYYLAYIDYIEGNLDSAYSLFEEVKEEMGVKRQKGIAPEYYLAQIDFTRAQYRKVISSGESLIRSGEESELLPETRRIVGLSYFKLGEYQQAREELLRYVRTPDLDPASDAIYALGVIDYRDGDYTGAQRRFASLTDLNNDLAQSAYLYLGQIAVKEGDSNAAAISFEKASKMNFDPKVTETALYNYIAARTRGGNIPFSSSIPLLRGFLEQFPRSQYASEVREYLATAYFNEKDYANALASINQISNPSSKVLGAKQKVLYELGMEAMVNGRAADARRYLSEATSLTGDASIRTQSWLWLGDADYALGKYAEAETAYQNYLRGDRKGENRTLATYNLAYALLMQDKYSQAASYFASSLNASPSLPSRLKEDALIRLADAQYYAGDYRQALNNYTKAIDGGALDSDYATYRRAIMYGLAGDTKRKLSELSSLPSLYPDSKWLADALLEKGQTYRGLGDTAKAVEAFEQLRSRHQQTAQGRKGMLNLALTYMQAGDTDKAESAYKEIITRWLTSEEAAMANDDLRRHYAAKGTLTEYAAFLAGVKGAPKMDADEMEKLSFEAAETAFADDVTSIGLLERYVENYPDGRWLAPALLDIAISRREAGRNEEALSSLAVILERRADSPQVGEALLMKGEILESLGATRRKEALAAYRELEKRGGASLASEAYAGIMRTTDKDADRMKYAALVKNGSGISADKIEEAEYYEASAMLRAGNAAKAEETLARLALNPKSLSGAKAAVELGQYQIDKGNVAAAEKTLTAFTDAGTPHEYWLARGFIALADVYHLRNKDYLAAEYLKSLRDNYPGDEPDIQEMITTRLKKWKQ